MKAARVYKAPEKFTEAAKEVLESCRNATKLQIVVRHLPRLTIRRMKDHISG